MNEQKTKYMWPYFAGIGLGLTLLAAITISGQGLGSSGTLMRTVVAAVDSVAPTHVDNNFYMAGYAGGDKNPFDDWLIWEALGVIVGGFLSGVFSGRFKKEINHGPRSNPKKRLVTAFIGGSLFGFGARLARGCTSGVALSGGATLAYGSWITMLCIFAGAYMLQYIFRKLWI